MTEREWLTGDDPVAMLRLLDGSDGTRLPDVGRKNLAGDRKMRLFACACARRVWRLLADGRSHGAVEVAERYADGLATASELSAARAAARDAARAAARAVQAALLRDVVGNPLRPVASPYERVPSRWGGEYEFRVAWLTPTVLAVARAAYEERPGRECGKCQGTGKELSPVYGAEAYGGTAARVVRYSPINNTRCSDCHAAGRVADGALDPTNLLVLADALEDAGCDGGELLGHLRSPGPHVRGCWALDLVLGKG